MGTARWEQETQERIEELGLQAEFSRRRRDLELMEMDIKMRMDSLQRELDTRIAEMALLDEEEGLRKQRKARSTDELLGIRSADVDTRQTTGSNSPVKDLDSLEE